MGWTGASPALTLRAGRRTAGVEMDRLEASVRTLDPGSRALLDLSLRRRVRDEAMAPFLRVDPFNIAWLRARAIERVASDLGMDDPIGIGWVRAALPRLGDAAWGVPSLPEPGAGTSGFDLTTFRSARVVRYTAPARPPVTDKLRSAAMGARSAARVRPHTVRAALRGALLTGAGAMLGLALSRRRR